MKDFTAPSPNGRGRPPGVPCLRSGVPLQLSQAANLLREIFLSTFF
jgi:hypothetical protein